MGTTPTSPSSTRKPSPKNQRTRNLRSISEGVRFVAVNGTVIVDNGRLKVASLRVKPWGAEFDNPQLLTRISHAQKDSP